MLTHDAAVSVAQEAFQAVLGLLDRAAEAGEERFRLADVPAHVHQDDQAVIVGGEDLLEGALNGLGPLVELVDALDRPFELEARLRNIARRFAKRRHHRHLGVPNLEGEQHQDKDEDQQKANRQGHGIAFHGSFFTPFCTASMRATRSSQRMTERGWFGSGFIFLSRAAPALRASRCALVPPGSAGSLPPCWCWPD